MDSSMTLEAVHAYKCTDCGDIAAESSEEVLYECGNCGPFTRSNSDDGDSNRCPQCHKFGAKVADEACESCQAAGVEEIDAYHCTECNSYFEEPDDGECPDCKRREASRQETERLSKLPPDQRGGQKTFATREDAEAAFARFLASVKSDHVSLVASPDISFADKEQRNGIEWKELPKPLVFFSFDVEVTVSDKYIKLRNTERDNRIMVVFTDGLYRDVDEAAREHLHGEIHWSNYRFSGFVLIEE
ncbi:MAG: hypothetical protein ACUZ8A_06440 [Candidatus Bathyanammoxibius sp.]